MAFVLFYSSYNQYKKSPSKRDLTGFDAAQAVTRDYNLDITLSNKEVVIQIIIITIRKLLNYPA